MTPAELTNRMGFPRADIHDMKTWQQPVTNPLLAALIKAKEQHLRDLERILEQLNKPSR